MSVVWNSMHVNFGYERAGGPADVVVHQGPRWIGVGWFSTALNCDLGHVQLDKGIAAIHLRLLICPYATRRNPVTISGGRSTILLHLLTRSRPEL